ncbi:hypothetical protein [Leptothermofonsia sp. ETS-13]|uniref:hypothetical protein n=1 Tax=Leptothermofonsia sp. ETS-13 TaxID=3035696 RepID=UPI003BA0FE5A
MENHPQSHEETPPVPSISDREASLQGAKKLNMEYVYQLVESHPLLFWGGTWVAVLLVAAIAMGGLLSPGLPARRTSSASFGSSPGSEEIQTAGRQGRSVPFWLFGAIAITCTAGSILVSKRLAQVERPHHRLSRPKRPVQYSSKVRRPGPSNRPRAPQGRRLKSFSEGEFPLSGTYSSYPPPPPSTSTSTSFKLPPAIKSKAKLASGHSAPKYAPQKPSVPESVPQKNVAPVPVTVVPSEESHPLDWGDPSLADLMDIRKRRSLSSWI